MDIDFASPLLGGLSPQTFMRRHWQKKPLLVRQAVPGGLDLVTRAQLVSMAAQEEVESRVIVRREAKWTLRQGPLSRSALPPFRQPAWTLLVQGLDLHLPAARALLERFRFVPDARVDDLMISYASDGGGVGPHVDSYDVFLLQTQGRRRWRFGRVDEPNLLPGLPLKILANFQAEEDVVLEPGDMLYLPPGWGHDGVAVGECMTCSIGFRASGRDELAREVLQRMLDGAAEARGDENDNAVADSRGPLYRDPRQIATDSPARIPPALAAFARDAIARLLNDSRALECALGEVLSEPKRGVWFDAPAEPADSAGGLGKPTVDAASGVRLDRRTRAMYDDAHVFINGEAFRAAGRDARLMRRLADRRELDGVEFARLSVEARALLDEWVDAGWLLRDHGGNSSTED